VPYRQGVDHAAPPAVLVGERGPVQVEPPAVAQRRERQELGDHLTPERGDRPDLHEARLPRERERPPPHYPPRRVASERLRRLRQVEPQELAGRDEAV
jgi:hypothetical protein